MSKKRILVVGGTGYLGQHLLQSLSEIQGTPYDVAFTHHSNPPQPLLQSIPHSLAFHLDLQTGQGFDAISQTFGQPHVVVNCAALSVPRACEKDPAATMSINVPSSLVKWLSSFKESDTLLIHLSTDQGRKNCVSHVASLYLNHIFFLLFTYMSYCSWIGTDHISTSVYEGVKSFYREEDETIPVNVYGKSKVAAEQFISANCPNYVILRSSIIFGPQTVSPIPKSLPIQWIDGVLSRGDNVEFFNDEFRCPVYVKDVVTIILALANKWITEGKQMQVLLNVGGPDRLSRVQMAEAVAHIRGYNTSLIKPVSASSVDRGVMSPADISMDISKLVQTLNISPVPFRDGVRLTLDTESGSS